MIKKIAFILSISFTAGIFGCPACVGRLTTQSPAFFSAEADKEMMSLNDAQKNIHVAQEATIEKLDTEIKEELT